MIVARAGWVVLFLLFCVVTSLSAEEIVALPGTKPLEIDGDIAMQMVAGVDTFLLRKTDESASSRDRVWQAGQKTSAEIDLFLKSDEKVGQFLSQRRAQLASMLGVVDERVKFPAPELVSTVDQAALVGEGETYKIFAVRWPTIRDMFAEGLLVVPNDEKARRGDVIAIPDADVTPEQFVGLMEGLPADAQVAKVFADNHFRVLIPTLISRKYEARNGRAKMTNREYIHRSAFVLGRHLIGYEVQQVLAGVDWFFTSEDKFPITVSGVGEGGMIAMYAAALDKRVSHMQTMGYYGVKEHVWKQPLDRNVFGILNELGDGEVCRLVAGRQTFGSSGYPKLVLPSEGGAPGELWRSSSDEFKRERDRGTMYALREFPRLKPGTFINLGTSTRMTSDPAPSGAELVSQVLDRQGKVGEFLKPQKLVTRRTTFDTAARQQRLLHAMDRHNQQLLAESPYVRAEFMKELDTSSPEKFAASAEVYREKFKRETIGWFDDERLPLNPRTRRIIDKEKYTGYEVVLDLWPDVFAYGVLLLPKNMPEGEKRPVVVCQHGLEGRPLDTIQGDHAAYHDFAAKLCERGFIVFCPQNLYLGGDKFRTLQRKANPLGKTLFSIIIPQHQQIVAWLKTLPEVDGERIAFYGLSYGGKSAMRIPPLVPEYCLSICSADFNDWVWKNASTRSPYSYVWTGEYEIFEWNLGNTFNYAEMSALIAPRPFMVERGHFDGVAPDEMVASEFAKVRHLYAARLKLPERCEIEFFDGPHTINGKGTFTFLHKHLNWPEPKP